MSDGPWKSLPMRPHWKQVARRAESGASSQDELFDAFQAALLKDAEELPVEAVRRAVGPEDQGALFPPDLSTLLDALGRDHPGSKPVDTLVTSIRDPDSVKSSPTEMVVSAVADTLVEIARDHTRAVAEHYHRKSRSSKVPIDRRLTTVLGMCDFRELASRVVAQSGTSGSSPGPAKRSGLDDGPLL